MHPVARFLLTLLLVISAAPAGAGQGPQNVAVVINARSYASVAIGHRYAKLRGIPTINLLYLDWDGSTVGTDVETFRQRLLVPALKAIEDRKLAPQITTLAWSCDFPYVIDFQADLKPDSQIDNTAKRFPQGSLTGLTYLTNMVVPKNPVYSQLATNLYYRPAVEDKLLLPTRSFPPQAVWNQQGDTTDTKGVRYWMSTMLGYTSGRGNSLDEVENYLQRAAAADGIYPAGCVYYLTNGDVRAKTRAPGFQGAATALHELGIEAEITDGILPRDRGNVMGLMIGATDYRFADSGSLVQPGAICENLTSFGGILRENAGQTALTECLRAGAAGSSGTVTEPFAIQAKFPHPMIHVHYAKGCSLAEAFYQAVQGPYQLLIVGDPLCRPWATIPTVHVAGLPAPGETITGQLILRPTASCVSGKHVKRFELYVDGRLMSQSAPAEELTTDTITWADGFHELRVVAYEDSPIETQGHFVTRVQSANHDWEPIKFEVSSVRPAWEDDITIHAHSPHGGALMLYHNQRLVCLTNAEEVTWKLPAAKFGPGPGEFNVLAARGNGTQHSFIGQAVEVEIQPPALSPAIPNPGETRPGLRLERDGQPVQIVERLADDWIAKSGLAADESFVLRGYFTANAAGLHQFQFEFSGDLELLVDGRPQAQPHAHRSTPGWHYYCPVNLAAGWHEVEIRGKLDQHKTLNACFGLQGTQTIAGGLFRHVE